MVVCVVAAAVVVIVLGRVLLCKGDDVNLLCDGRFMVRDIGLFLIC